MKSVSVIQETMRKSSRHNTSLREILNLQITHDAGLTKDRPQLHEEM